MSAKTLTHARRRKYDSEGMLARTVRLCGECCTVKPVAQFAKGYTCKRCYRAGDKRHATLKETTA